MIVDFDKKILIGGTKILFAFIYEQSLLTNNVLHNHHREQAQSTSKQFVP